MVGWRMRLLQKCFSALLVFSSVCCGPALAFDVNSFRAQHKLPPLAYSSAYAGAAQAHANDLARRDHLDHNGFRQRVAAIGSRAAENVAYIQCRRGSAQPAQTGGLFGGLL